jgi:hypothetical protein
LGKYVFGNLSAGRFWAKTLYCSAASENACLKAFCFEQIAQMIEWLKGLGIN